MYIARVIINSGVYKKLHLNNDILNLGSLNEDGSFPETLVDYIQEMACTDANNETYEGDEFISFCKKYKKLYLTPNYLKIKLRLISIIRNMPYTGNRIFLNLDNFYCKLGVGSTQSFASVYNENGELVLFFTNKKGWIQTPSKTEEYFQAYANEIYCETFSKAYAQIVSQKNSSLDNDSTFFMNLLS